jgi:hypothetical protein
VGTDLQAFYEADEAERSARDTYFQDPIPSQLARLRGTGHFRFDRTIEVSFDPTYTLVALRYSIYASAAATQPELHLQMEMLRETDREGVYWTLIYLEDAKEIDRRMHSRQQHRPRVR